jgi:hypothetical protein
MGFDLTLAPCDSKCHFSVPSGNISLHHLRPTNNLKKYFLRKNVTYLPETFLTVQKSKAAKIRVPMNVVTSLSRRLFKKR